MLKYKLTTQDLKTHNGFKWEIGKTITTDGSKYLCSSGWLHYYHHPLLAVLLNIIHANIYNPKLWEVEASGLHKDDRGMKGGCTELTLIKELSVPSITNIQRIAFAILITKQVYKETSWNIWADNWLNNIDRTTITAKAIRTAMYITTNVASPASYTVYAAADAAYANHNAACAIVDATVRYIAAGYTDADQLLIKAAEKCLDY